MAGLSAGARKLIFSGRAVLLVLVWAGLLGFGVHHAVHGGAVYDATGRALSEARLLAAELAPDAKVVLIGASPLEAFLVPLGRSVNRVTVQRVEPAKLAAWVGDPRQRLREGDVQVSAGRAWLILRQPTLQQVLNALAQVSSPAAPQPATGPPTAHIQRLPSGKSFSLEDGMRALIWVASGVSLPLLVTLFGLIWRRKRNGA